MHSTCSDYGVSTKVTINHIQLDERLTEGVDLTEQRSALHPGPPRWGVVTLLTVLKRLLGAQSIRRT
jgi:hypothetical protein